MFVYSRPSKTTRNHTHFLKNSGNGLNALFISQNEKNTPEKIYSLESRKKDGLHTHLHWIAAAAAVDAPLNWLCWKKSCQGENRIREWRGEIKTLFFTGEEEKKKKKKQMNLGKDIYHKRKILSHEQCSSPPIPLLSFILTCRSDCSRKSLLQKRRHQKSWRRRRNRNALFVVTIK